jgi:RNA polymerase sigma-70 factor (ECF subfamily)
VTRDPDLLAAAFSQARPRLVRVAYAIIGSHSEAEDVVADCWFRLVAADKDEPVRDVEAWAVVAVSRMALDVLRSARVRRERYVGPWLPEPVIAAPDEAAADPADKVTLADEVGYAILVVTETLSPAGRPRPSGNSRPAPGGTSAVSPPGHRPTRPSTGAWSRRSPWRRPQATWRR